MATLTIIINDDNDDGDVPDEEPSDEPIAIVSTLPTDSFSRFNIYLYVLRQANPSSNWKIQANFVGGPKYVFKAAPLLTRPVVS